VGKPEGNKQQGKRRHKWEAKVKGTAIHATGREVT
jgi:hypothetical protein